MEAVLRSNALHFQNGHARLCCETAVRALSISWDRVVYVYDGDEPSTKNGTTMKKNDTISFNWMLANYLHDFLWCFKALENLLSH